MKTLLATILFATTPAAPQAPKIYKPFVYETACVLEYQGQKYPDVCKVIETREPGGALRTRNIFSNKHRLTIKGRFDNTKGYMTWDSHNQREYKWEYKVGFTNQGTWTYVMPGFLLENVSWD